jgi:PTS system D-glucosamine-specific IIC component
MFGSLFGKKKDIFASPFTGTLCPITETPDEAFAEKMNGDGFMVQPADGDVYAPADSTVNFVFETKHALGMTTKDSMEYLLHIGIDTVNLQGKGFTVYVKEGQAVKKGDKLMTFDTAYVKANAPSDACLCVFTGLPEGREVALLKTGSVKALEDAVEIK